MSQELQDKVTGSIKREIDKYNLRADEERKSTNYIVLRVLSTSKNQYAFDIHLSFNGLRTVAGIVRPEEDVRDGRPVNSRRRDSHVHNRSFEYNDGDRHRIQEFQDALRRECMDNDFAKVADVNELSEKIAALLVAAESPQAAAELLAEIFCEKTGADEITAVCEALGLSAQQIHQNR